MGMVMRHVRLNYSCVIAFWDPRCQASDEWMERMGIRDLSRGVDQAFYHVLVNDGSTRYAAEGKKASKTDIYFYFHLT